MPELAHDDPATAGRFPLPQGCGASRRPSSLVRVPDGRDVPEHTRMHLLAELAQDAEHLLGPRARPHVPDVLETVPRTERVELPRVLDALEKGAPPASGEAQEVVGEVSGPRVDELRLAAFLHVPAGEGVGGAGHGYLRVSARIIAQGGRVGRRRRNDGRRSPPARPRSSRAARRRRGSRGPTTAGLRGRRVRGGCRG